MRLSIGFTVLLLTIGFVQSNPLFNGLLNQFASQSNLANQLNGLASQVGNALSSGQLQTIGQQVFQLAQGVINGNIDANVAASQFLSQVQQYLGSNSQLYNTVANIVQQLLNANGLGLTRPALSRQFQIDDLQDLIAQYPQYAGLVNQGAAIASDVLALLSPAQLQLLQKLALDVANKVVSGKLSVSAAANQLLGALSPVLASNTELFNKVQSFVQQVVNAAQTILSGFGTRLALPSVFNQFKPSDLQGLLAQYPQYAALINQFTGLASQVVSTLSPAQLQTLGQQVLQLAQGVMSGQVDANAAANQLLGELQQLFGSNTQLFSAIANAIQQILTASGVGLTRPALSRKLQISDLETLVGEYPEYANLAGPLAALAEQTIAALTSSQLASLEALVLQLAPSVINGQLDANVAGGQLLAQIQQYLGSNTQLYNAIANAVQQLVNLGQGY